ncbi:MAG TPA: YggS family pyridoxal phosphate-dependent enzyme [Turneriella sp.]|nr:YggS family pyridoxal phosphate-dependent enzyme [Turneriella sp.]
MSLQENYQHVREQIANACVRSGRPPESVSLIAVSKTHPASYVDQVAALGQVHFAENRIAELVEKKASVQAPALHWHLIGQLQTNKVKLLEADTILHTLDRASLADKLQSRFTDATISCLLQVNCSGEPSKSGVAPAEFNALADYVAQKPAIRILGLMTMAENTEDEWRIREAFAKLRQLSEGLQARRIFPGYKGWLSMGMSGDFELAIAEGATHVRVGSAIFGSR